MTDFLRIDLDDFAQPADVRLRDDSNSYEIVITQVHFNKTGANICRLRSDQKAKEFVLTTDEMHALATAWTEYQILIAQHEIDLEAQKQQTIAEAKALAKSVHFDLAGLNVRGITNDYGWKVVIPAMGFERQAHDADELLEMVQAALDNIKQEVERAEQFNCWHLDEWKTIVTSYRRTFPLAQQGEPAEIAQARELLKEGLHITDWAIANVYPGTDNDCWSFDNGQDGDEHISLLNHPATNILDFVSQYITESKRERGETSEQITAFWANHQTASVAGGC